ncbi:MAG TPA: TIGR00730 family Rossman fold protein [Candidatus Margulisiibacteriota bacterium]|nr:TIGR00730 family Rossman fold protein [Candidatus Margulisiibacteriota bacterium]
MQRLCVFCGSSPGANSQYAALARRLGGLLVRRGLGLVYGGGNVGLMGVLADAVLKDGGHVIGVIPQSLVDLEVAHAGLPDLRIVASMHERKALMADLADGFVALPGGIGTLEEFCEILTWAQLGLHQKPCGLINVAGYFDRLMGFLDHAVSERFLRPEHRAMVLVEPDAEALLDRFAAYQPPQLEKWIDRGST